MNPTPEHDAHRDSNASLREVMLHRPTAFAVLAMFLIAIGGVALAVILGLQVYDITGSKLDLGWLGLAEFGPTALLVLVSGHVVDRFDRRIVFAIALLGEIAVISAIAFVARQPDPQMSLIYLCVVGYGVTRAFASPAIRTLIPASAARPSLVPRVAAVSSVGWQAGAIIGPILGAFTYKADPDLAYACVIGLFLLALPCIAMIPKSVGLAHRNEFQAPPSLSTALDGLRVVRRNPILFGAISLDLFAVLFGGAVALLPALADERNWDKGSVGLLRAVGAIGGSLVTIVLAVRPIGRRVGRWLLAVVGAFGAATMLFGFTDSLIIAACAMFALNAADSVSVFIRSTLVPVATPADQRGRVMAVENVFIGASNELGAFESGVAGRFFGTVPAIVSGGLASILIVGIWWFAFPALRDVDRFDDAMPR